MKIVTWNCNGAFRKKFQMIDRFDADLYVIQECEKPENSTDGYRSWSGTNFWRGENKHKGLGIFAKQGVEITLLPWEDGGLQLFLPVRVNDRFNLVAVWTKQANSPTFGYIGQLWKYLELHKDKLAAGNAVLCGDLNSNKIWDVWDRWWNHSDVVRELGNANMQSLYHLATGEEQGVESTPTFFLHRKLNRPYHIDFVFASSGLFRPEFNVVSIGNHAEWLEHSDHMPVAFTTRY
jgi:exonuclease III